MNEFGATDDLSEEVERVKFYEDGLVLGWKNEDTIAGDNWQPLKDHYVRPSIWSDFKQRVQLVKDNL